MRYIHNEDDPVRMAADLVAARRRNVVGCKRVEVRQGSSIDMELDADADAGTQEPAKVPEAVVPPAGSEDGKYYSRTKAGNYRPFRHRTGPNHSLPPGSRNAGGQGVG